MKRQTDQAIVLGRINYGEADRIVTMLLKESGKVTVIAKGARKLRSKLAGGIEPLCLNEVSYIPSKSGMSTLVSSMMKQNYSGIVRDYNVSQLAHGYMVWLNEHLEDGTGSEYFDTLQGSYVLMNLGADNDLAYCFFYSRALDISGQAINVSTDSSGAKLVESESYSFDHENSCFTPDSQGAYSAAHIKLLRMCLSVDPEVISRLKEDKGIAAGVARILRDHQALL